MSFFRLLENNLSEYSIDGPYKLDPCGTAYHTLPSLTICTFSYITVKFIIWPIGMKFETDYDQCSMMATEGVSRLSN